LNKIEVFMYTDLHSNEADLTVLVHEHNNDNYMWEYRSARQELKHIPADAYGLKSRARAMVVVKLYG
jgi:hypothetical protein